MMIPDSSLIECGIQCDLTECKAFQFNTSTHVCSLYGYVEICPSNTSCSNVTIFINNRHNNLYTGNISYPRFQILNGLKEKIDSDNLTAFEILDPKLAQSIFRGFGHKNLLVLGSVNNSKLIAIPNLEMILPNSEGISKHQKLANNLVSFLTSGFCTQFLKCYKIFNDKNIKESVFINYISRTSVFVVPSDFNKDFKALKMAISVNKNNWHFIVGGKNENYTEFVKPLLEMYGIGIAKGQDKTDWIMGNICKDIETDVPSPGD